MKDQNSSVQDDNLVQPFQLDVSDLRGRSVKLGSVLNDVLEPHAYPNPVAHLVAEMMTLTLLLSSMLKYEGLFTLQANGDGPVSLLLADVTSEGQVRACATYDDERLELARKQISDLKTPEGSQNHLAQYLGKGYMTFTVQPKNGEPYQGIVELKGASLVDCVQHYFVQSAQIGTGIKMAAGQRNGEWRAAAIMLQHLPEDEKNPTAGHGNIDEDDWRRTMIFLDSCTDEEFLDPALPSTDLLYRLFHEEGVRVFEPLPVKKGCRCGTTKVERVLNSMQTEDLADMVVDDKITVKCEFCSREFEFDPGDFIKDS